MLTNYHTHTTRCGHAEGTEEEYILTALRCGYTVLGFSDHTPWKYADPHFVSRIRMLPEELDGYVQTLSALRERYADRLHIHIGLEAEYFPAYLPWLDEEMERLGIEYLVFGCHYDTTDETGRYFGRPESGKDLRRYAEQVTAGLETGRYACLAHPDICLNHWTAYDKDAEAACREIDRVADRGATILQGRGGYGGAPKDVVLCACSNKQLYEIEHAMQDMDPSCFIIMLQSNEVHGEGFRQLELGKGEDSK